MNKELNKGLIDKLYKLEVYWTANDHSPKVEDII